VIVNLIRKDLIALRLYFLFVLAYAIVFGITAVSPYSPVMICALPAIMMTLFASSLEMRGKSLLFIGSLPVRRKQIVLAKYASVFVYLALGFVLAAAVRLVNEYAIGQSFPIPAIHLAIAAGLAMFYAAAYYPIQFWLGVRNSAVVSFLVIFLTAAGIGGIANAANVLDIGTPSYSALFWGMPAVGLVLLVASYFLSARIFSRKDIEG